MRVYCERLNEAGVGVSPVVGGGGRLGAETPSFAQEPPTEEELQSYFETMSRFHGLHPFSSSSGRVSPGERTAATSMTVEAETVTRTLRGGGETARVQRRDVESPAKKDFKREARKKPQIRYYHQDPDKRSNKFRGGSANKSWDKVTNEMPFASSVPTTMPTMFVVRPKKFYRELGRVVDTLDSVCTKAAR